MPKSRKKLSFTSFNNQMLGYFSLGVFIFIGFLSSIFLVGTPQDNRNQAMSDAGLVEVRSSVTPSTNISQGQTAQVALQLNTHNVSIVGTQFIIAVDTTPGSGAFAPLTPDQVVIPPQSGFQSLYKNVVDLGGGSYEIQLSLRPAGDISSSLRFSNNSFVTIAQFPVSAIGLSGQRFFTYDPEMSYILDGENVDVMKSTNNFTISIIDDPLPPTATPKVTSTQPSTSPTTYRSPYPTKNPSATRTPYPTRDPRITRRPAERPPFFYPRSKFRRRVREYLQERDNSWWERWRSR